VRVQIEFEGELIADTRDAIRLEETHVGHVVGHVVYYIPRMDVQMEQLVRTSHETSCPFKGEASYYSLKDGPENAVWSYEQRHDESGHGGRQGRVWRRLRDPHDGNVAPERQSLCPALHLGSPDRGRCRRAAPVPGLSADSHRRRAARGARAANRTSRAALGRT